MEKIGQAYLRKDGTKGIRNIVLVIYTVNCVSKIAKEIGSYFGINSNVDVIGCEACKPNDLMERKLVSFSLNPNVGSVLVVSKGCEGIRAQLIMENILKHGKKAELLVFNDSDNYRSLINRGIEIVKRMQSDISSVPLVDFFYNDLICACECGGSDFTSGLVANPIVGELNDFLISQGATVLFEEMYEAIGLKNLLEDRCIDSKAKHQISFAYDKYYSRAVQNGQFSISPGNIRGGLSTIEEKSMGAVIKTGSSPINGVLKLCERPPKSGLYFVDMLPDDETNCGFNVSEDASSDFLYATCGAQLCILTSGRGHVVNNPIIPTIKITGNSKTFSNLSDDMDLNASDVLEGKKTIKEMKDELLEIMLNVIQGTSTKGEKHGHRECVLNFEYQQPIA